MEAIRGGGGEVIKGVRGRIGNGMHACGGRISMRRIQRLFVTCRMKTEKEKKGEERRFGN